MHQASDWTLYKYQGHKLFEISIDSLKSLGSLKMNQDSMSEFVNSATILHTKAPLIWMGGFIATCNLNGTLRKIDLSIYGGYFYDEKSSTYYQLPIEKIDAWLAFIQNSYMAFRDSKN
jgi:hypothetical protein